MLAIKNDLITQEVNILANIKSAKKRIKVIEKKTALNRARKSQLKTALRRFDEAVAAGNVEEATARFKYAQKRIQQVAAKGTLHKTDPTTPPPCPACTHSKYSTQTRQPHCIQLIIKPTRYRIHTHTAQAGAGVW